MKKILASLLCGFLALVAVGCGDSNSNDYNQVSGQQGAPGPATSGSIAAVLSAADLDAMFSAAALAQTIDPSITQFYLYAFDAAGNLVASTNTARVPGAGINLALQGLQLLNFDVVLAGLDSQGNLVGAYEAENIAPLPNGLREIGRDVFVILEGFVLPDDTNNPPTPDQNIDVSVSFVENVPQITFTGGNVQNVSAVPEDLIEAFSRGQVRPGSDDFARIYTRSGTSDNISSPTLLNSAAISGTTTNLLFDGFEAGVVYQISVARTNGDFGFVNHVLVP